jgi:hypothetical protein
MKNPYKNKGLQVIPSIGPSMAVDLIDLGYRSVSDLKGEDPEAMYARLCRLRGRPVDRCVLYVFRCAVYFAGTKNPEPELLKWWNWKDKKGAE